MESAVNSPPRTLIVQPKPRSAFALVIVLFACTICALTIILLLSRVSSNVKATVSYSDAARLRALSDMSLGLVQAQVRDATTRNQTSSTPMTQRSTWASQPGALRVYTSAGSLDSIFKLYSSDQMQTTDPDLAKDVPTDWFQKKSLYTDLNEPVLVDSRKAYPILNPDSAALNPGATGISDGFSITGAPAEKTSGANTAPMPVRWIYVLSDGTLCQLGDSRINKKSNPIVGRIAFWADDETCKVNLNTAAPTTANSFWDTPRVVGSDSLFAWNQPAQNEYQRYPGHPGMVSLRPILGSLSNLASADYYGITPLYRWGGSEDGAKDIKTTTSRLSLLVNKQDRIYATSDEILFKSTGVNTRNPLGAQQVESLSFFLTTSSKAPELNLFGQPRVSIWPISAIDDAQHRTPFDSLIAFCSTVAGKPYYLVRNFPLDASRDFTDYARNQELFTYLQNLSATPFPGFGGGTFLTKYNADRDQILTEIFDYIRCTNLNETFQGRGAGFKSYTPDLAGAANTLGNITSQAGAGFVVPLKINGNRGGGRFPAIQGAALWFVQHLQDPTKAEGPTNPRQMQAALLVKTTTPMHGFMPWQAAATEFIVSNVSVRFSVPGNTEYGTFPGGTTKTIGYAPFYISNGMSPGGYDGAMWTLGQSNTPQWLGLTPAPFFSTNLAVGSASTFSIEAGSAEVTIRVAGKDIQSYRLDFPAVAGLPLPTVNPTDGSAAVAQPWWFARCGPGYQFAPLNGDVMRGIELPHGDARLTLMNNPASGFVTGFTPHIDYADTTKRFAHSMRGNDGYPFLWTGGTTGTYVQGVSYYQAPFTSPSDKTMIYSSSPDIPAGINGLRSKGWSADFDNGFGVFPDGPFLNKPDEGSSSFNNTERPYDRCVWQTADGLFSPLRQVPSPVMFGSLPTGVKAEIPWRTLLFCPNPADPTHPGFSSPPDHLLLDLFRMPVVEPYAMGGPTSTDGKINMNYAIAPFSYIKRTSSWYALFQALKVTAIPDTEAKRYKDRLSGTSVNTRLSVDVDKTLSQFEERFQKKDIFRSATEICSIFLVPSGQDLASVQNLASGFWSGYRITGDNTREKPYAEIYPKITTQSNTFRVHLRVQVLPKSDAVPAGKADFEPLAEYRGSRLVERFLSPGNPALSSVNPDKQCLNDLFQYRVLQEKRFSP